MTLSDYTREQVVTLIHDAHAAINNGTLLKQFCEDRGITEEQCYACCYDYAQKHLTRPKRRLIIEVWHDNREIFKAVLGEILSFSLIIGSLVLAHLVFNSLEYPEQRKAIFELWHYRIFVIIWGIFSFSFVIKALIFAGQSIQRSWRSLYQEIKDG